ncbi:MAG: hypothetical protein ACNA8W_21750 [Bradymonadaceae bacterium]
MQFHHWLDGEVDRSTRSVDGLGWPEDVLQQVDLALGGSFVPAPDSEARHGLELGIDSELIDIPALNSPGKNVSWHRGSLMTGMGLGSTFAPEGVSDFRFHGRLTFAGFLARSLEENESSGALEGFSLLFGSTIAFRHNEYDFPGFRDRLGVIHLPGLTVDLRLIGDDVGFRFGVDVHPDFAAVQSAALPDYALTNSLDGTKSVLANQGYYYAWGFTRHYRMELSYGALTLRSNVSRQNYRSIEGYDRFQYAVTDDFSIGDRFTTRENTLEFRLLHTPAHVGISSQRRVRTGTIKNIETTLDDRRLIGRLRFGF